MAYARSLAIRRGAVAIHACALTLSGSQLRLTHHVEELRGTVMQHCGGVVDPCGV